MNWDEYFLRMVRFVAMKSKDTSNKVGAVLVGPGREILTTGYNGPPRGLRDDVPERQERPEKYQWIAHAEQNAVFNAARVGVSLIGATAYISDPCIDCARALIQAGVREVVLASPEFSPFRQREDWIPSLDKALDMLKEAGVGIRLVDLPPKSFEL